MQFGQRASIDVGDLLPSLELDITPTVVVATAIAARDFHPLHHDLDYARNNGHPQVFLNILASAGFVERYVQDWLGGGARVLSTRTRLGVPHYAGEVLTLSGAVTAVDPADGVVELTVKGNNPRGQHLQTILRASIVG